MLASSLGVLGSARAAPRLERRTTLETFAEPRSSSVASASHLAVMSRGAAPRSHEGEGKEEARSATMIASERETTSRKRTTPPVASRSTSPPAASLRPGLPSRSFTGPPKPAAKSGLSEMTETLSPSCSSFSTRRRPTKFSSPPATTRTSFPARCSPGALLMRADTKPRPAPRRCPIPPIAAVERIVDAKRTGLLFRAAAIEDLGRVEGTQKAWAEKAAEARRAARSAGRMVKLLCPVPCGSQVKGR
mmetsp:Transcript_25045/g.59762  ORF Transcript_25045/g.59762 Transcript_25045/m.59762 type:complete len:247 (-) Transcript_25045:36-776(-)